MVIHLRNAQIVEERGGAIRLETFSDAGAFILRGAQAQQVREARERRRGVIRLYGLIELADEVGELVS